MNGINDIIIMVLFKYLCIDYHHHSPADISHDNS